MFKMWQVCKIHDHKNTTVVSTGNDTSHLFLIVVGHMCCLKAIFCMYVCMFKIAIVKLDF